MSTNYVANPNGAAVNPSHGPAEANAETGDAYQAAGTALNVFPAPTSGNPTGVYGPAFIKNATGKAYQAAGTTYNDPAAHNTGNPDPVYGPGFFAAALLHNYQPSAQTTDSQVGPTIVFQVNLETVNRQGHLVPNRTNLVGNETVSEADNQKFTRQLWLPGTVVDGDGNVGGPVAIEGIAGIINGRNNPQGYLTHGDQFTVKGEKAIYLKKQFVSSPASPADLLIVISQS